MTRYFSKSGGKVLSFHWICFWNDLSIQWKRVLKLIWILIEYFAGNAVLKLSNFNQIIINYKL